MQYTEQTQNSRRITAEDHDLKNRVADNVKNRLQRIRPEIIRKTWEHLGYVEFEVKYICPLCTRRTDIQTECKRSSILCYLSDRQT